MANVRNLKKDINYVLGDIIEAAYLWEFTNPEKSKEKTDAIVDEAIETFDRLIAKVNEKNVEDKKKHFKSIHVELALKGTELIDKLNALS